MLQSRPLAAHRDLRAHADPGPRADEGWAGALRPPLLFPDRSGVPESQGCGQRAWVDRLIWPPFPRESLRRKQGQYAEVHARNPLLCCI